MSWNQNPTSQLQPWREGSALSACAPLRVSPSFSPTALSRTPTPAAPASQRAARDDCGTRARYRV